jgi:hypothetical protein
MYKTKTLEEWMKTATEATIRAAELKFKKGASWPKTFEIIVTEYPNERITFTKMRSNLRKHPDYKKTELEDTGFKEMFSIDGDTFKSVKLLDLNEKQKKDPNYMLNAHGFDPKEYKLIKAQNKKWNVYSKLHGVQQLYSSSIVAEPRNEVNLEEIKEWFDKFKQTYKTPKRDYVSYNPKGTMLEVHVDDLHTGKLGWVGDSGESYDYKIARERALHIINDVINQTQHFKYEKILFIWSHDFFHFDNINQTTTAGTDQDSDLRWQKVFDVGMELLIDMVELLATQAPVETFYIASNHDRMTGYYAIKTLHAWFRKDDRVTVDVATIGRKYYRYGNTAIGFYHGDSLKKSKVKNLIPVEQPKMWGDTLYHEIHAAHFHSEKTVDEDNGVITRYTSSPTGTDYWHYQHGFVGAVKKAEHFVWDKEKGLRAIIMTPII